MEVRMKMVEELVRKETKEYVAFDGTVFNTVQDCEEYEQSLREAVLEGIKTINCSPPSEYDYYDFNWYYVETKEQLKILEDFVDDDNIECDSFPQWIGVATTYDNENWIFGTLDGYKKDMDKFFNQFN